MNMAKWEKSIHTLSTAIFEQPCLVSTTGYLSKLAWKDSAEITPNCAIAMKPR